MSEHHVRPARPHLKLTEDGRRMREVLTYSRRGSRFTPRQQQAWDAYADRYVIPDEDVDREDFDLSACFDHPERPLAVEIGCGVGEATVALAAARPETNILGIEVWRPGVADCVGRVRRGRPRPTSGCPPSTRSGRWSTWCPRAG